MQQVTNRVFVETEFRGSNVGVLATSEGLVAIDSPHLPYDALQWKAELAKKGQLRYIINTEPHGDHIAGDYFLPATVVATEGARDAMAQPGAMESVRQRVLELAPETGPLMDGYSVRLPSITFSDRMSLYVGGHVLHLIHLPGHTRDSLVVHIPGEGVVFTGDNVVFRIGPFFHEALPNAWLRSLKKIEALDAEWIVPGHGVVCPKSYVREFTGEIEDCIGMVKDAIARGLFREEAAAQVDYMSKYAQAGGVPNDVRFTLQRTGVARLHDLLTHRLDEDDS